MQSFADLADYTVFKLFENTNIFEIKDYAHAHTYLDAVPDDALHGCCDADQLQ